jgi:hypothetical protein
MNEVEIPLKLGGIAAIKAELRDLQGQIANAADADTMAELAQQAGKLKDQIKDANEQIAVFATVSKFEAVSNSFGAIKNDLMSLDFEGASEKAQVFAKNMASIKPDDISKAFKGLTSTLGSIGKAFMSLGQTLLANPIYLIAAVIAGVIAITVMLADKLGYLDQAAEAAGLVFDALIETIKQFGEAMGITAAQSEEYVAMQEANTKANEEAEKSTAKVIEVTNEVGTAFDMAKEGVISKEEALATYNEKLGDTFGAATTLAEAERLYVAKTDAYIAATMARARAEVFAKKAAEADAKAIMAKTKDQTTALDKVTTWVDENKALAYTAGVLTMGTGAAVVATLDAMDQSGKSLSDKQKMRVGEEQKRQGKISNMYQDEAKKALKTALELEKSNEINIQGSKKKTASNKKQSDQRIKDAEKEAERLRAIAKKENEDRIKKEDAQFDLMNKLTMTQAQYEKQKLTEEFDKQNEIAEGNAELEKLLLEQLGKDKAAIDQKYADEAAKKQEEADKKAKDEAEKKAQALKQAQDLIFNMNATQQEKDIRALEEKLAEDRKIIGDNAAAQLQLTEKFEADKKAIETKYTLEKIENAKKEREAKLQLASDIANGINEVGSAFIKDQKKLEKFNKANALIQIGIDTAKAISSLVAASQANPFNGLTAGAAGIAQFASGIIQIVTNVAKAKQILTSGGAPSAGGGGTSTEASGGGANVAQQVPQAAQLFGSANTGNVMSAGGTTNESSMTVTAIVSESQVTNVQNKINKINKNAEL